MTRWWFFRADIEAVVKLKKILDQFAALSGLYTNFDKSNPRSVWLIVARRPSSTRFGEAGHGAAAFCQAGRFPDRAMAGLRSP